MDWMSHRRIYIPDHSVPLLNAQMPMTMTPSFRVISSVSLFTLAKHSGTYRVLGSHEVIRKGTNLCFETQPCFWRCARLDVCTTMAHFSPEPTPPTIEPRPGDIPRFEPDELPTLVRHTFAHIQPWSRDGRYFLAYNIGTEHAHVLTRHLWTTRRKLPKSRASLDWWKRPHFGHEGRQTSRCCPVPN